MYCFRARGGDSDSLARRLKAAAMVAAFYTAGLHIYFELWEGNPTTRADLREATRYNAPKDWYG